MGMDRHAAGGDVGVAIIVHKVLPLLNLGPHEHLGINQCRKAAELAWWKDLCVLLPRDGGRDDKWAVTYI